MNPFRLRDKFLNRVKVGHQSELEGIPVKIIVDRGFPYHPIEWEAVVEDSFFMPPPMNVKPVLENAVMVYMTFNKDNLEGVEMYIKEDGSLHAQILTLDQMTYKKASVSLNHVDLGWYDYRAVISKRY